MNRTRKNRLPLFIAVATILLVATETGAQSIDAHRADGANALAAGDFYSAIQSFGHVLEVNSADLESVSGMASSYYWLGEYDQAAVFAERARLLGGNDPGVLTLSGRIAIGLGELETAREYFDRAQLLQPNNVAAQTGLAELAIAEGRGLDARAALERVLQINPDHRKSILSLVLVHEQSGDIETAQAYLDLALRSHGNSPETHVLAAEFAIRQGRIQEAASHARTAQSLDANSRAAAGLRAQIALLDGRFLEAVTTTEELLRTRRNDALVWYIRGQSLVGTGASESAMESFLTALRYAPDDEVIRLVAENLALDVFEMESPVRAQLADVIRQRARVSESEFRFQEALALYQRSLRLAPFNVEIRREYAELHRTLGHTATYLQELTVIAQEPGTDVSAQISVYQNVLSESVSARWDVDQFTLARHQTRIAIFLAPAQGTLLHPLSSRSIARALGRSLASLERVDVIHGGQVGDFSEAFAAARSQDVDFFILLNIFEAPRAFALESRLYVGRTGSEAADISVARTGPDRVSDAIHAFVRRTNRLFPTQMSVLRRRGDTVLLDAGIRDGIDVESELQVVPPGTVIGQPFALGISYDPETVLGTIEVTSTDDLVSEGMLSTRGIVDSVVTGDIVIVPGTAVVERSAPALYPLLYERVRSLR